MTPQNSAKFMRIVSYLLIALSLTWGLAPFESINLPALVLLDVLDWPFGDAPSVLDKATMWLSAVGAGLLLGLSIFFLGIVAPAIERGDKQIIKVATWAISMWFVVDSAGSIAAGVTSNAVFNTFYLMAILYPMLAVKYGQQATIKITKGLET